MSLNIATHSKRKRLLIISYNYPPLPTIGALRVASFVDHLPKSDWDPYVLTIQAGRWSPLGGSIPKEEEPSKVCRTHSIDVSRMVTAMFGKSFRGGGVTRSKAMRFKRKPLLSAAMQVYDNFLAFPDSAWPWLYLGRGQARAFADAVQPDVLLSSSVPFTSHLVAADLQARLGCPWVCDFRDLWSRSPWIDYPPYARRMRESLESRTMRGASALLATSAIQAASLREQHAKPTHVVFNGFEPAEYMGRMPLYKEFTIAYTGSLYPGKRDPRLLFQAVRGLAEEGKIHPNNLKFVFCGPDHDVTVRMAEQFGIQAFVEDWGPLPRERAIELQRRSHILLALEWPNAAAAGGIPAKLFEYLGAGRPVLAIGPKGGSMDSILAETGRGKVVSEGSEVRDSLLASLEAHREGRLPSFEAIDARIMQYTREKQAKVLASVLSGLVPG